MEDIISKLATEQPWLGLTAYLGEYPHLVIGKLDDETFVLEDESGNIRHVKFAFDWEEPRVEENRFVAATRAEEGELPPLSYDPEDGSWLVVADGGNSTGLDLGGMGVSGPTTQEHPGAGHNEPTIEVRAACPHCHSDQHLELASDDKHPHSDEKKYVCHNCGKWSHEHELEVSEHDKNGQGKNPEDVNYEEHDDDADRHQDPLEEKEVHDESNKFDFDSDEKKKHHTSNFHAQGFPAAASHIAEGIAINLDKEDPSAAMTRIQGLPSPYDASQVFVNQKNKEFGTSFSPYDNPFVNRGGKVADRLPIPDSGQKYPEHFEHSNQYILIKRFIAQDDIHWILNPQCAGVLSSEGGTMSHVQVVAKGAGKVSIIAADDILDQINPGDQVVLDGHTGEISVNGARGVYQRPQNFTDIIADEPIYRFAFANGHGYSEKMQPGALTGELGGHQGMLGMLMGEGHMQIDPTDYSHNATYGFFCSNGVIIQDINTINVNEEDFVNWAHQEEQRLGLPEGRVKMKDISQGDFAPGGGASAAPEMNEGSVVSKVAAAFEMAYPGGQGIHNGTSAAFAQAGLHATVTAPGLPQPITLPFSAPNMFIMIKMFQAQGLLSPGTPITVESDDPQLAQQIIDQQSGVAAKVGYSTGEELPSGGPKPEEANVCPHCGSHTIEMLSKDDANGSAEWLCLTCDNTFKHDYRRTAAAKHPKGTRVQMTHPTKKGIKGSIVDHAGTDENFGDDLYDLMLDNGDELKKVPEIHFNKIKSASIIVIAALHDEVAEYAAMMAHATDQDPDEIAADLADKGMIHSDEEWTEVLQVINHVRGKNPNALASLQKGAPYPEKSYHNAPDHSPHGQDWPAEVNAVYNACMREGGKSKSSCAAIAWSQYHKSVSEHGHGTSEEEGKKREGAGPADPSQLQQQGNTPPCPHCGNPTTGTPNYYWCPSCGWTSQSSQVPGGAPGVPNAAPQTAPMAPPAQTFHSSIKSAALSVGEWYTMYSPDYKVPDVIQVVEVNDHGVTANIEGDDKGLFPITLPHNEIESAGYRFEPYSNPSQVIEAKIARRQFSSQEQSDLINENLDGLARNYHKLNLEGTHYKQEVESSVDPLSDEFWLW